MTAVVSWVVVVVDVVAGSLTTVVHELRTAAKAGTIQISVNVVFIIQVVTSFMVDSLQVPISDVLNQLLFGPYRAVNPTKPPHGLSIFLDFRNRNFPAEIARIVNAVDQFHQFNRLIHVIDRRRPASDRVEKIR